MSLNQKSVLLRTSAATDVVYGQGTVTVAGAEVRLNEIRRIRQIKYRANTAQVFTIGSNSYTPTASTTYTVLIGNPQRKLNGNSQSLVPFKYTTPSDLTTLGATAALQREAIHVALVAAITAQDDALQVSAATLGTGTGFTITDTGVYFGPRTEGKSNFFGANTVVVQKDGNGNGWENDVSTTANATAIVLTTPAVYWSGVGAYLLSDVPSVDNMYGRVISGTTVGNGLFYAPAPKTVGGDTAVSGQRYDLFIIESMRRTHLPTLNDQYYGYVDTQTFVFVDNGAGTDTANLAGFGTFEGAMVQLMAGQYAADPATILYMGNTGPTCGGLNTGLPDGTSLAENFINFGNGYSTHYYPLGTNTLVALTATNDGIGCVLDATNGEGVELSAPTWANSLKNATIGKTAFSIYAKIKVDDVSGVNPMWVGFRKQAAANATYTSYSDYAFIGLGNATGDIYTSTENDGGGNTNTDTTQNWADNETHTLEVRVDINGAVTFFIDGYAPTVTQSFSFDSGDVVIPVFCYALQAADIGTPFLQKGAFLNSDTWRG